MGFVLRLLVSLLIAVAIGVASAWWWTGEIARSSAVQNGAWSTNTAVGSADADMYTRAAVARFGLLALNRSETIYFNASTDDSGAPLSGDCTYRIEGGVIPARWSSLTAYGGDQFLIENEAKVYSFQISRILQEDGSFLIRASAERTEGNWLPVAAGAPFLLSLRLYNPDPAAVADPTSFAAPRILKETCR